MDFRILLNLFHPFTENTQMGRKRKSNEPIGTSQLVVRLSESLETDLRTAARFLDLDLSNLVRMILAKHLSTYVIEGARARADAQEARRIMTELGQEPVTRNDPLIEEEKPRKISATEQTEPQQPDSTTDEVST